MNYKIIEILLVEDNLADATDTKLFLKREKIINHLHHETNAHRALHYIRECKVAPDVIIINLALTGNAAYALIHELKQQEKCKDSWFVVCAASTDSKDIENMMRLCIDFYVEKPLNREKFRRIVQYIDGLSNAIVRQMKH